MQRCIQALRQRLRGQVHGPAGERIPEPCERHAEGDTVQLLGLRWDRSGVAERDAVIAASVREVAALRQPGAFPILMAHHPHAFDAAAAAGLPLTLSGHTHGGQLMLGDDLGAGPLFFRYWSGVYRRGASQLVVSNGVGNWFPLRINAPAEIVHLTLRTAS